MKINNKNTILNYIFISAVCLFFITILICPSSSQVVDQSKELVIIDDEEQNYIFYSPHTSIDNITTESVITWVVVNKTGIDKYMDISIERLDNYTHKIHYSFNKTLIQELKESKIALDSIKEKYDLNDDDKKFSNFSKATKNYPIKKEKGNVSFDKENIDIENDGSFIIFNDGKAGNIAKIGLGTVTLETIETTNNVGYYTDIKVDSEYNVHIVHFDTDADRQRYCTNSSGSWSCGVIEDVYTGQYGSLALDSQDRPHVASRYTGDTPDSLRYCNKNSGSWNCSTLDTSGGSEGYGIFTDIAVDQNDDIHIVHGTTIKSLRYCTNTSGSFLCERIVYGSGTGYYNKITVDTNNKVHISFGENGQYDLVYCGGSYGSWSCVDVDTDGLVGIGTAIAVDSNFDVHIIDQDYSNDEMDHCTNRSGSWSCSTFTSGYAYYTAGEYQSLEIDLNDTLHVTDYDEGSLSLFYCQGTLTGSFQCTKAVEGGIGNNIGSNSNIAIDDLNNIYVSFRNITGGDLQFYTNITTFPISDSCTCPTSGQWDIDCADNCVITSGCNMDGSDLTIIGTGTATFQDNITGFGDVLMQGTDTSNRCIILCDGGCLT